MDPRMSEAVSAMSLPVRQLKRNIFEMHFLGETSVPPPWPGTERTDVTLGGTTEAAGWPEGWVSADAHSLPPPRERDPWQQLPHPEVCGEVQAVAFPPLSPGGRHCEDRRVLRVQGKPTRGSDRRLKLSLATEETAARRDPCFPAPRA